MLDLFVLTMGGVWLWAVFWLIPSMERQKPGFVDFLVKTTGKWIVWYIMIWTMLTLSVMTSTIVKWLTDDPATIFASSIMAQTAYWMWMRHSLGVYPNRFKIY